MTEIGAFINAQTEDATPDGANDLVLTYDADAGAVKKVKLDNLPAAAGGNVATDAIWDAAGDLVVGTGANSAARLAKGTARQSPRMKSDASTLEWGNQDCQVLGEVVVGAGGAASVTFSSIPATFRHLRLIAQVRGDTGAANIAINATLNDDSGNNYAFQRAYVSTSAITKIVLAPNAGNFAEGSVFTLYGLMGNT